MASSKGTEKYIDILLVGKTGSGKSATGNTILRGEAFECSNGMTAFTKDVSYDYSQFERTKLKVVDSPGLCDTDMDEIDGLELVINAMTEAISANPEGYHAVLVVVRFGGRFTREDIQTISQLKRIFGDNFIKQHAILVMTCGDIFNKGKRNQSFEEWCMKQRGTFAEIYRECMQRVILFDNTLEDEVQINDQVRRLLIMIDNLTTRGGRYTNEQFAEAKESRKRLLASKPSLHETVLRNFSLMIDQLSKIKLKNPEVEAVRLEMLKSKIFNLEKEIHKEDRGTDCLLSAKELVEKMINTVDKYLKNLQHPQKLNKELLELKEELEKLKEKEAEEKLREKQDKEKKKDTKKEGKAEKKESEPTELGVMRPGEIRENRKRKAVGASAYPEEDRQISVGNKKYDKLMADTEEKTLSQRTEESVGEKITVQQTKGLTMDGNDNSDDLEDTIEGHTNTSSLCRPIYVRKKSLTKRELNTQRTRLKERLFQLTGTLEKCMERFEGEKEQDVIILRKEYKIIKSTGSKPVLKSVADAIKRPIWNRFKRLN